MNILWILAFIFGMQSAALRVREGSTPLTFFMFTMAVLCAVFGGLAR